MKKYIKVYAIFRIIFFGSFLMIAFQANRAFPQETVRFKLMWPALHQPWLFNQPHDVAVDDAGYVYIADTGNNSIQKFTSDGQLINRWGGSKDIQKKALLPTGLTTAGSRYVYVADVANHCIHKFTADGVFVTRWGTQGEKDGQFSTPMDVAVDLKGYVYVADAGNHRIQKFTLDGQFVSQWGAQGKGEGEFDKPSGIAVGSEGEVYVADTQNHRIQKFSSSGKFIDQWGSRGGDEGQFDQPLHLTVDEKGQVYVADGGNDRIQIFTSTGKFISKLGSPGNANGQLKSPAGVAVGKYGRVYVADKGNSRLQVFNAKGQYNTHWGLTGSENGKFNSPHGIALGARGDIFIADSRNHRIQIFSPDGRFLGSRGGPGIGEWQFANPQGLAFSQRGFLYVADTGNHRIQTFTPNGKFAAQWGSQGGDNGQFNLPSGVAAARDGFVYVTDTGNHRVQKFNPEGKFVALWGKPGKDKGQFSFPSGIVVDPNGDVYVADTGNHRIQKFNSDGKFIHAWGSHGQNRNEFISPEGLTVDKRGNVFVADTGNNRVQKFSAEGKFIAVWGTAGGDPGELNQPVALAVGPDGKVYVSERSNHRIQLFAEAAATTNQKMIIVAGGGPFEGNNLWNATQACSNFAYRASTFQGFTRETIQYLSANPSLDLDDIDADAQNKNLQDAITKWASDADSLVLYLVDHGGTGTFRMSGTEILRAADLNTWLDELQHKIPGRVIVVYDACESGSFLPSLTSSTGKKRIVISSTSPGEEAQFVSQGSVSFSNFFWTRIFNGSDVRDAFQSARDTIGYAPMAQNSMVEANGNGVGNEAADLPLTQAVFIGNGTGYFGGGPQIVKVSPDQTISNVNSALLYADGVTDGDGIDRVWAVIRPPDYKLSTPTNPLQELPSIDLEPVGGNRYEATFSGFNIEGTHYITIFARDRIGDTSLPRMTTVSVGSPRRRRAVIATGGGTADENWPAVERNIRLCWDALRFQGYTDDDIYLMSPAAIAGVSLPFTSPTLDNLSTALTSWAPKNTQDVVVYFIGPGGVQNVKINADETLWAAHLDAWLDNLQGLIPGNLTFIHDASQGGSFLPLLTPPAGKERILISGTSNQHATFASHGDISFSAFFWRQVFNGASVRDAFVIATNAIGYLGQGQTPLLDDSGNGIGNEPGRDGRIARNYTIGFGIKLFGDAPVIGGVPPEKTLTGENSALIRAEDVTTTGTIDSVWAVISPPGLAFGQLNSSGTDLPMLVLNPAGNNRYEATYTDFTLFGTYRVALYAMDTNGSISFHKLMTVNQTVGADIYEVDDTFEQANVIGLNGALPQQHNFHDDGDQDWVRFFGIAGQVYEIKISNVGDDTDPAIELYGPDGTTLEEGPLSAGLKGDDELMIWTCTENGIYYAKIYYVNPDGFGKNAGYDLEIYRPVQTGSGIIKGYIRDATNPNRVIVDANLITDGGGSAISLPPMGSYLMTHPAGLSWTVTASKPGDYHALSHAPVEVSDLGAITSLDFLLTPIDTDADGLPDYIENAVACLDVNDPDTDDDGIVDGDEDKNKNGIHDPHETDPCKPDTDGDLIQDGTESGITLSDIGPGTNSVIFKPDADSSTKTDPADDDTDNDRWRDGEEDKNRNGRVDAGEKDPNRFNARFLSHIPLLLLE